MKLYLASSNTNKVLELQAMADALRGQGRAAAPAVEIASAAAMGRAGLLDPLNSAVVVTLAATMGIPGSQSKKRKAAMAAGEALRQTGGL